MNLLLWQTVFIITQGRCGQYYNYLKLSVFFPLFHASLLIKTYFHRVLTSTYFTGLSYSSDRSDTILRYILNTLVRDMKPIRWLFMSTTGR